MNLNTQKLEKIFHEVLKIITDLQLIDKDCQQRGCQLAREKIHVLLIECQKHILQLRIDLLDAIEDEGD